MSSSSLGQIMGRVVEAIEADVMPAIPATFERRQLRTATWFLRRAATAFELLAPHLLADSRDIATTLTAVVPDGYRSRLAALQSGIETTSVDFSSVVELHDEAMALLDDVIATGGCDRERASDEQIQQLLMRMLQRELAFDPPTLSLRQA